MNIGGYALLRLVHTEVLADDPTEPSQRLGVFLQVNIRPLDDETRPDHEL